MGRHDEKFSTEQREACVGAALDGMTAQEVADAAAAGELELDPFTLSPSTIQAWVDSWRRSEGVKEQGSEEAERARAIAQETIAAIEAKPAAQRTSKELHALESALRLVHRTDRVAPRKPPPKPPLACPIVSPR